MAGLKEVPYEIVIHATDEGNMPLDDFANFLRDLVSFHDRLCVLSSARFSDYDVFSSFFYTRRGRPIPVEYSLRLAQLRKESPYDIRVILASVAVVGAVAEPFVNALKNLALLPGEYKKQQGEIRKQRLEEALLAEQVENVRLDNIQRKRLIADAIVKHVHQNTEVPERFNEEADRLLRRDIERIDEHRIRITDVETLKTINVEDTDQGSSRDS